MKIRRKAGRVYDEISVEVDLAKAPGKWTAKQLLKSVLYDVVDQLVDQGGYIQVGGSKKPEHIRVALRLAPRHK